MSAPSPSEPATTRVVVLGAAGGEGATTVTALLAAVRAGAALATRFTSRADDPLAARWGGVDTPHAPALVDPGPHGSDETARAGDVTVVVCAATTAAIERGKQLLGEGDARGSSPAALVICARSASEGLRGRVRMQRAAAVDERVVLLPYDPALARTVRVNVSEVTAATRASAARLRTLLGW